MKSKSFLLVVNALYCLAVEAAEPDNIPQAAWSNNRETLSLMLERGVDPNQKYAGATALHLAAEYGYTEIADFLLRHGATVDVADTSGLTPLYWATANHHVEIVRLLLAAGADPALRNENGITPFSAAATSNDVGLVELLVASGKKLPPRDITALQNAVQSGKIEIVRLLLAAGANVCARETNKTNAFGEAAAGESFEILKMLSDNAAACPQVFGDALINAAENGRLKNLEYLLALAQRAPAQPPSQLNEDSEEKRNLGAAALQRAIQDGQEEAAIFLVKHDDKLSPQDIGKELATAISQKRSRVVKVLVERGALDVPNHLMVLPLDAACQQDDLETVKLLLERGASPMPRQPEGSFPLLTACAHGTAPVVELLLKNGASLKIKDRNKETPLLTAAAAGKVDICRLLIARGCNVSAANEATGFTALHHAAVKDNVALAEALLSLGANPATKDKYGKTAADTAEENGSMEVFDLVSKRSRTTSDRHR